MGTIKKIDNDYYIEFYARGLLYQQKAGPDLAQAERMLNEVEATIAGGEALTIVREVELRIFFADFLNDCRLRESARTVARFESTIKHFQSHLKNNQSNVTRLSQVTPVVIEGYKTGSIKTVEESGRKLNPCKVNLTLLLLREILEYGIKIGFINDNPTLHIGLLKVKAKPLEFISEAEYAQLVEAAEVSGARGLNLNNMKALSSQHGIRFSSFKNSFACKMLKKGVPLMRVCRFLELTDVAKIMRWAACIPQSREDVYGSTHCVRSPLS